MKTEFLYSDTVLPQFMQYPEYLLSIELSETEKLIYVVLYDRARLSIKNGWADDGNHIYVIYTISQLSKRIGKSESTVKKSLKKLEDIGLLIRKRNASSRANNIYVKIPTYIAESNGDKTMTVSKVINELIGVEKTTPYTGKKRTTSKVIETSNDIKNKRVNKDFRHSYSRMKKEMPDYSFEEGESL